MLTLAVIGPALFFLPGLIFYGEAYFRGTPRTMRQGQQPTTAGTVAALITLISLLVHSLLLGLLLLVSNHLIESGATDGLAVWPQAAFSGSGGVSLDQLTAILWYFMVAVLVAWVGSWAFGKWGQSDDLDESIPGLFRHADSSDRLQVVAYIYLDNYPPGADEEGGYVGAVSQMRLTSEGRVDWVQLIDPNRFTVTITDGDDPRAEIREWNAGRDGTTLFLEERLPVAAFASDQFSHVVFALYGAIIDEDLGLDEVQDLVLDRPSD